MRIKEIMKEKGVTQPELAEKMGYSPQYMSKLVKGS